MAHMLTDSLINMVWFAPVSYGGIQILRQRASYAWESSKDEIEQ